MKVSINGNDVKFGYGLYFLGKAQKKFNTDLNGLLQSMVKNPLSDIVDLMYFSAQCEAELDDIELPINKRDFIEHLEKNNDFDNNKGVLSEWSTKFMDNIKGHFLPKVDDEDVENVEPSKKK